ncbi:hypothetical protein [Paraburkholderia sp. BCC1884]|uniref:hypothetical protein n=1 Tax=Paraburkholderia sp. BCC1884 TaxID=2562668 RepID=UPI001183E31E|nr:hypothetical protein [Paraburkholderia sp. BCC1884]
MDTNRSELIREVDAAMVALDAFMKTGSDCDIESLCHLSGLLHVIGCRLGRLLNEFPDDQNLVALLKQCAALQATTMEQAEALTHMTRAALAERQSSGASLH